MHLPQRTLCLIGATLALGSAVSGCRLIDRFTRGDATSDVKVDAEARAKVSQFVASVDNGVLRTKSAGKSAWLQEARDQLAYASGQLAELGGLMDTGRVDVELGAVKEEGGATFVAYKASFPVSWNADLLAPATLILYLPKGGDKDARHAFFVAYGNTCADPAAADLALRSFWYHYRPNRPNCDLGKGTFDRSLVGRPTLSLVAAVPPTQPAASKSP